MLTAEIKKLLEQQPIKLFNEEKEYAIANSLISAEEINEVLPSQQRWTDLYIERGNKETEEFLGEETNSFLQEKISYLRSNQQEFLYMESKWFENIGIEGIILEENDVFHTYDIIFGLKKQKKYGDHLRKILSEKFPPEAKYSILFNGNDGLWDINLPISYLNGFSEDMTIEEVLSHSYQFLFKMVVDLENNR
ncbi:branched-chain amino acid aminotransferase [Cytobacillus gottheilii]|uniref:branched-chain amino acid aminotransferase n=1 Tax=Cytobacillus gottheilii TaxID=859144 RepID=UPI0024943896|nr:branched-chain amino acid aminotransferase [Cytobacillus gottheilii]